MLLKNGQIADTFSWFCKPVYKIESDALVMTTSGDSDFWQRTHYGFARDNGHFLRCAHDGDFSMQVATRFFPLAQYDQCGLMVRVDSQNWIKMSTEYETPTHSRLGSVVTNLGWSDWATIDRAGDCTNMSYRIQRRGKDFLLEYAEDGQDWHQLRITHLHAVGSVVEIGMYACSPIGGGARMEFSNLKIEPLQWKKV